MVNEIHMNYFLGEIKKLQQFSNGELQGEAVKARLVVIAERLMILFEEIETAEDKRFTLPIKGSRLVYLMLNAIGFDIDQKYHQYMIAKGKADAPNKGETNNYEWRPIDILRVAFSLDRDRRWLPLQHQDQKSSYEKQAEIYTLGGAQVETFSKLSPGQLLDFFTHGKAESKLALLVLFAKYDVVPYRIYEILTKAIGKPEHVRMAAALFIKEFIRVAEWIQDQLIQNSEPAKVAKTKTKKKGK